MQQIHEIIASLAEEQDMEVQDVPEYEPFYEVDMTFVFLLYNYILALKAEEREEEQQRQEEVELPAGRRRPFIRSCCRRPWLLWSWRSSPRNLTDMASASPSLVLPGYVSTSLGSHLLLYSRLRVHQI